MAFSIVITLCLLVLIAYTFDLSSKHTKIPTVILLLLIGWLVKECTVYFEINLPDFKPLLPVLGTVGLILIVLEGSLDLELNKSKKEILGKTSLSALIPLIILFFLLGFVFGNLSKAGFLIGIINALPFCIISSSIAIPSVQNLSSDKKEFIIYESSLSDIFGVIIFNFFLADQINTKGALYFFLQILVIIIFSILTSVLLAWLIKKIDHHVKFIPILTVLILIYCISKIFHLPALIFILVFGLFLNNINQLSKLNFIQILEPRKLYLEVRRFKGIIIEITFLVRTMFFLLFGFLIDTKSFFNIKSLFIAAVIVLLIIGIRYLLLRLLKLEISHLLFIAPRGLITILLFLSIPASKQISLINETLVIQVVIISALVMMGGLVFQKQDS